MSAPTSGTDDPATRGLALQALLSFLLVGAFFAAIVFLFSYEPRGSSKGASSTSGAGLPNLLASAASAGTPEEVRARLQNAYDRHAAAIMLVRHKKSLPSYSKTDEDQEEAQFYANLWGLYSDEVKAVQTDGETSADRGPHDLDWLKEEYNFSESEDTSHAEWWKPRLDRMTQTIEDFALTGNVATVKRRERGVNVLMDSSQQSVGERDIFDMWHLKDGEWKIIYTERGAEKDKTEPAGTTVNTPAPAQGE